MTKQKAINLIVDFWEFTTPAIEVLKWYGPRAYSSSASASDAFEGFHTHLLGKAEKLLESDIDAFIDEYYVAQEFWENKDGLR